MLNKNILTTVYSLKNGIKNVRINYTITKYSTIQTKLKQENNVTVGGIEYKKDNWTNITPKILSYIGRNIYLTENNPLNLIRQRIIEYFYNNYKNSRGNPLYSVHDRINPVVSIGQNFDNLLIDANHPSRAKTDCYYVNKEYLLRAHTTAHQADFVRSGLDNFLIVGEVYRRDEIDTTHYPVFHQMDAVHIKSCTSLYKKDDPDLKIMESNKNYNNTIGNYKKQQCHTLEAVKLMEHDLKSTLLGLAKYLFGEKIQHRWVETEFPFTEPSWELEIFYNNKWLEVLGCGIMQNAILESAGVKNKIGWAFGLGLERLAMCLYQIPDIRLFWSNDTGFLNQFNVKDVSENITYKPVSQYPQCYNDISFWLPENTENTFSANDFYDLVRNVGGDIIEQVSLVDVFKNPKTGKISHCYRITYRHMERTLTQPEVNKVHQKIEKVAREDLGVTVR